MDATTLSSITSIKLDTLVSDASLLCSNVAPNFVKAALPIALIKQRSSCGIDFRTPVDSNPFYLDMITSAQGKIMLDALLDFNSWRLRQHYLLVGSSGCGKTSMGFAVAAKRYMIYLVCPAEVVHAGLGYMLAGKVWAPDADREKPHRMTTDLDMMREFICAEIVARLTVLLAMLKMHGQAFSALHWLVFSIKQGGVWINDIYKTAVANKSQCTFRFVNDLLSQIETIVEYTPMIMIDELHLLAETSIKEEGRRMTLMKVVIGSLLRLSCPVVWSGTRVGVGHTRDFAAAMDGSGRPALKVLGGFSYLESSQVSAYLEKLFVLGDNVSNHVKQKLAYTLQGRSRLVTSFVCEVLAEKGVRLQPSSSTSAGTATVTVICSDDSPLTDDFLLKIFPNFERYQIVDPFLIEIQHLSRLSGDDAVGPIDLGKHWANAMVQKHMVVMQMRERSNCLIFTSAVWKAAEHIGYMFEYNFREPSVLDALLDFILKNPDMANDSNYHQPTSANN